MRWGILSSHGTETRSRGAERWIRRQVLSLSKKYCPRHTCFSPCFLQHEHCFYYPVLIFLHPRAKLNTPLKYPEVSWTLISIWFSHSHELIRGSIQSRWKAARLSAGSGGTWDGPPGCFLVPAPHRRISHCSLASHSLWLTFPSYASPSDRCFDSDFLFSSFPPSRPKGRTIPGKEKCPLPHVAETFTGSFREERGDFREHMAKNIWRFSDGKWPMRSQRGFIYKW